MEEQKLPSVWWWAAGGPSPTPLGAARGRDGGVLSAPGRLPLLVLWGFLHGCPWSWLPAQPWVWVLAPPGLSLVGDTGLVSASGSVCTGVFAHVLLSSGQGYFLLMYQMTLWDRDDWKCFPALILVLAFGLPQHFIFCLVLWFIVRASLFPKYVKTSQKVCVCCAYVPTQIGLGKV